MIRILRSTTIVLVVLAAAVQAQTAPTAPAQTTLPRPEYPRPEFVRADWMNLNGTWDFSMDLSNTGEERGLIGGRRGRDRRGAGA